MAKTRRKFDKDFTEGAVRRCGETRKPIAQVARDLGSNEGTLGSSVNADKRRRGEGSGALGARCPAGRWGCPGPGAKTGLSRLRVGTDVEGPGR
jgi:hypothetical protein